MAMLSLILVLLSFVTPSTAGTGQIVCTGWGLWGAWGACDVTCGEGTMKRGRIPLGGKRCEGSGEGTMACVLAACPTGCDPKTIDFNKEALLVKPQEHFKEEWLLGGWYGIRWYLGQNKNVSDEIYDTYIYGYQKEDQPDKIFWNYVFREKTKKCCSGPFEAIDTRKSHGIYEYTPAGENRINRITKLYVSEVFLMELYCHYPKEDICSDYSVMLWSRCKDPRPQDIAKAVSILKEICYPHMKRFLDTQHRKKCWKMDRVHKCSCDPKTIDFNKEALLVKPLEHFKEEWLLGGWYAARWYLGQTNNVSEFMDDTYIYGYQKEDQSDKIFWKVFFSVDTITIEKTKKCCISPRETNETRKSHGIYEWAPPGGKWIYRITKLYVSEVFMMWLYCHDPKEDVCSDYSVMLWSRCMDPRPQDIAKAVSILKKICYPHMKRFLDAKHRKKCGKMDMEDKCSEDDEDIKEDMRRSHWYQCDDDDDYHGTKCGGRGRCYDGPDDDMRPHRRDRCDNDDDDDGDDDMRRRDSCDRAYPKRKVRPRRCY